MRYIDTGAREPQHSLGYWLKQAVGDKPRIRALRWQTGFFAADALGFFKPAFDLAKTHDRTTRLLVGANDGMTLRSDVVALLQATGGRRRNLQMGIVNFGNAYFHPKTIHVEREDGSTAAYVGSANLTRSGVSVHVEAGILLDSRDGDDPQILSDIAHAVDWWFAEPRPGFNSIAKLSDVDALVTEGVLSVEPPPGIKRDGSSGPAAGEKLGSLIKIPPWSVETPALQVPAATWSKKLTVSDAQRKRAGNQRGSVALVQAGHAINAQSYFRHNLFKDAKWRAERTRTGEIRQVANIPFNVTMLGQPIGGLNLVISYASNREASQANYTSLLHLGDLTDYFRRFDLTGQWLRISRRADGQFDLSIGS